VRRGPSHKLLLHVLGRLFIEVRGLKAAIRELREICAIFVTGGRGGGVVQIPERLGFGSSGFAVGSLVVVGPEPLGTRQGRSWVRGRRSCSVVGIASKVSWSFWNTFLVVDEL